MFGPTGSLCALESCSLGGDGGPMKKAEKLDRLRQMTRGEVRRHEVGAAALPPELERERALDTLQTAALLGLAAITLAQMRARGEGPRFFRIGRSIRYRLGDVIAFRDARSAGRSEPPSTGPRFVRVIKDLCSP